MAPTSGSARDTGGDPGEFRELQAAARADGPGVKRQMAACRSCKAAIVWAVTGNGKAMPIDAEPSAGGNVALTDAAVLGATVLGPLELDAARAAGTELHMPHHATCPDAGSWRR